MVESGSALLQRRLDLYIATCVAAVAPVALLSWTIDARLDLRAIAVLGSVIFISEQFPVRLPSGSTYSLSFVLTITAIAVAGPSDAMIVTLLGSVNIPVARARPLKRNLFNAAQLAVSAGLAGIAYLMAGGQELIAGSSPASVALPLLVATAVDFPANTLLVSGAIARSGADSTLGVWRAQFRSMWTSYVAFGALGLLLAVLYVEVGPPSALLLIAPLLFARHAFAAAGAMREAFEATVRVMAEALEVKDRYTRGHAERVSRLAEMTARAAGLPEDACVAARHAGLMHDIGKLTVAGGVLRHPGKLADHEHDHIKAHAAAGAQIIEGIDVLAPALPGVRHHHERLDGKGYPDGLAGDEIPLVARIVAVADAFDALTSTRSYRNGRDTAAALAELWRCAGTQFDPGCVTALEAAVTTEGWEPSPEKRISLEEPIPNRLKLDNEMPNQLEGKHAAG